jgi:hypothetical protein
MDIKFEDGGMSFTKELSKLDELALLFSERLSLAGFKHVFLSGYVAILFGRNRTSEDIDVVCEDVSFEAFTLFWEGIHEILECIITSDVHEAYDNYLKKEMAVRFAYKGEFIPNIEMKFATTAMHREALDKTLEVNVNGHRILIPSLDQQIAYKMFMGSEKDIEDARFLFKLFEERLDKHGLTIYLDALGMSMQRAKQYLGWSD